MKKIIIVCLAIVMLLSLSLAVFAEPGGFVRSPSLNQAPVLIEYENDNDGCNAYVVVTPYADREELCEELRLMIEEAYEEIKENPDLSKLNEDIDLSKFDEELKDIAKENECEVIDLAVRDLFDVHLEGCTVHDHHGLYRIRLETETLENFICLLRYYKGEWLIVEDVEVLEDGKYLEFYEDEFSPFAIVVDSTKEVDAPQTSDSYFAFLAIAVISGIALLGLSISYKKSRA